MRREFSIYKTLRFLARQRIAVILQPGNVWVVEKAMPDTEQNQENIQTCLIRGWLEVFQESVPTGKLTEELKLPSGNIFDGKKAIYRLTDSGWNAIHRSHVLLILSLILALLGVAIPLLASKC